MSELTDELRQLSDDASRHARPQAIAEVIKRGNRRRYRTIARRSIGGLSVAGLGVAVFFTGAFSNPAFSPGAAAAGAASSKGVIKQTQTTSLNGVALTVNVSYRHEPKSTVKIISVTYSGSARTPLKNPFLTIKFGVNLSSNPVKPPPLYFVTFGHKRVSHFSGSVPASAIRVLNFDKPIPVTDSVNIALSQQAKKSGPNPFHNAILENSQILN